MTITAATPRRRSAADLGELTYLTSGGESTIYAMGEAPGHLYKCYFEPRQWHADLGSLVELPQAMTSAHRSLVLARTSWPLAGVTDGNDDTMAVGSVIPRAPDQFWFTPVKSRTTRPISELFFPTKVGDGVRWPSHEEVLGVLCQLAELVAVLHGYGVTLGDISHANCFFTLEPAPAIFAIDCDSYFTSEAPLARYRQTPDWDDPRGPGPDYGSDVYKLALLITRALMGDNAARPSRTLPSRRPYGPPNPLIDHLICEAVGEPGSRPSARDWAHALGSARDDLPDRLPAAYDSPLAAAMQGDWDAAARLLVTRPGGPALTRIVRAHTATSAA